ncbi:MAG: precorrin-8X methylmutase [Kutzneria sp.]|nr:precorrin-8X methylmutase [Kutzneria sp.]
MTGPSEAESYRILRSRVDTSDLPPLTRSVVERVVHTTADTSWIGDLVVDEAALQAGRAALAAGAPLVVDVRMLAAAVAPLPAVVGLDQRGVSDLAGTAGVTRSAAGIRMAARRYPDGAVWAIGNAPTALGEVVRLARVGELRAELVIGVPVGFVGSVDSKAALRRSGLPSISTRTERGGAAVAAAVLNALTRNLDPGEAGAHVG